MEEQNPLSLYNCLVPEIDAYRPLRPPLNKEIREANLVAKYRLKELEESKAIETANQLE